MQNVLDKITKEVDMKITRKQKIDAHVIAWEDYNISVLLERINNLE